VGWSIRKSFKILPGIRLNLSKSGPRISAGIPGARVSVGTNGKAKVYGSAGPLRYNKQISLGADQKAAPNSGRGSGLLAVLFRIFNRED
jgi:hypothetical protein